MKVYAIIITYHDDNDHRSTYAKLVFGHAYRSAEYAERNAAALNESLRQFGITDRSYSVKQIYIGSL